MAIMPSEKTLCFSCEKRYDYSYNCFRSIKPTNKISTCDQKLNLDEILLASLTFLLVLISSVIVFKGSLNMAAVGQVIPGLSV